MGLGDGRRHLDIVLGQEIVQSFILHDKLVTLILQLIKVARLGRSCLFYLLNLFLELAVFFLTACQLEFKFAQLARAHIGLSSASTSAALTRS